ncbi:MAG: hypothetical protein K9K67_03035 [Bacteriovoracaceae bacterium]|nr:hypothetical protein [Bacteriovoracaceae bacterium]
MRNIQRFQTMAVKNIKYRALSEDGQAIFELLIFLPILVFLYTVIFNVGNSINVSINQQKATRRFLYFLAKGNSYLPSSNDLNTFKSGFVRAGISLVGYADRLEGGQQPIAPCFKFNALFTDSVDEDCETPNSGDRSSSYVRVFSAYGICGENYSLQGNKWTVFHSGSPGESDPKSKLLACAVQPN